MTTMLSRARSWNAVMTATPGEPLPRRCAGRFPRRCAAADTCRTVPAGKNLFAPAPRNVANTTIVPWADRLPCGWEGGRPYALNSQSLGTLGEETFGASLPNGAFLAHMRLDSGADRLVGCSIKMGMPSRFTFREYDRDGTEVASCEASVPGMHFVHDFVVTPR